MFLKDEFELYIRFIYHIHSVSSHLPLVYPNGPKRKDTVLINFVRSATRSVVLSSYSGFQHKTKCKDITEYCFKCLKHTFP